MNRLPDWETRLARAIAAARRTPYKLGDHDCFLFAGRVAQALTGADPVAIYKGTYATRLESLRLMVSLGGSAEAVVDAVFGFPRQDRNFARRGDLHLIEFGGDPHLGVDLGPSLAVPAETGFVVFPRATPFWRAAWRAGD